MDVAPATPLTALPPPAAPPRERRSPFVAAALGWLIPGAAQLYVGRPGKALLMFLTIGGLFYAGLHLTAFTCVNPQTYSLEFAAHSLLGGPTAAVYFLTSDVHLDRLMSWFEAGRLYAAVAGLLNLVAICDALGDVLEHNRVARMHDSLQRRLVREREEERLRLLAQAEAEAAAAGTDAGSDSDEDFERDPEQAGEPL